MRFTASGPLVLLTALAVGGCYGVHERPGDDASVPSDAPVTGCPSSPPQPLPTVSLEPIGDAAGCELGALPEGVSVTAITPRTADVGIRLELTRDDPAAPPYACAVTVSEIGADIAERMLEPPFAVTGVITPTSVRLSTAEDVVLLWVEAASLGDTHGDTTVRPRRAECVTAPDRCVLTTFILVGHRVGSDSQVELRGRSDEEPLDHDRTAWVRALLTRNEGCVDPRAAFVYFRAAPPD